MSEEQPTKVPRPDESSVINQPQLPALQGASAAALLEALHCSLCLSLICEPISIACGHSFCRICLVESLRRHKKSCPSCRAVCHVSAENASENIMLKALAMALDPDTYASRLAEAQIAKQDWSLLYPCFFYNSTMFPGSRLALHLFEPRYRQMMQRIVNTTQAFAYVPNFRDYRANVGDVALVARLKDVSILAGIHAVPLVHHLMRVFFC